MNPTPPDENPEEHAFVRNLRRHQFSPAPDEWREPVLSAAAAALPPPVVAGRVKTRRHRGYRTLVKAMAALWAVSLALWADTLRLGARASAPTSIPAMSLHPGMEDYEETARLLTQSHNPAFPDTSSRP